MYTASFSGAAFLSAIVMSLVCIAALFGGVQTAHAESPVAGSDGRYNVSYEIGGQSGIGAEMIAKYFDKTVVVEKIGNHYYASVTQLSSSLENLSLNLADGMQVGYRITEDGGSRKTYSYTLSEENLSKAFYKGDPLKISFSAKYLTDAIKSINGQKVRVLFTGEMRPFIIKDFEREDIIQLVLPVRTY